MMEYKGYVGRVEVDAEAGIIHGRVLGLRDIVTFEGQTVAEARQAFQDSIEDYLAFCAERGEAPEKPHSGTLQVRLGPELHRALAKIAEAEATSINDVIRRAVEDRVQREGRETRSSRSQRMSKSR